LQELFNKIRKFRKFIKSWEVGSWELLKVSINGLQNNICIEFSFNIYRKKIQSFPESTYVQNRNIRYFMRCPGY